jgi:hypothetical protein
MKKIILNLIICFVGTFTLNAQSKLTVNEKKTSSLEIENQFVSIFHPKRNALSIVSNGINSKKNLNITRSNRINENAGAHLKNAGRMLYWGSAATAIGQVVSLLGEPVTGTILSLGGTITIFLGYRQIEKAGIQMQQSGSY